MRYAGTALLLLILGASSISPAMAQRTKPENAARPNPNDDLIKFISGYANQHAKKDEFETSAANQARVAAFTGHGFVLEFPATRQAYASAEPLAYDADAGVMTVSLVGNSSIDALKVIDSLSPEGKKIGSSALLTGSYTKFFLVKTEPSTVRTYQGTNGFGATTLVKEYRSEETSVAMTNVLDRYNAKPLQQKITMAGPQAQQLKGRAKWRLTVETVMLPGQKDFILSDGNYIEPTISNPIEIVVSGNTIMATLLKAELFDPQTATVYATFVPQQQNDTPPSSTLVPRPGRFGVYLSNTPSAGGVGGLAVVLVAQGTPAAAAGIKSGDVLLSLGDTRLGSNTDLLNTLAAVSAGKTVVAHVRRGTELLDLQVQF